jgi:hypothetical protein
MLLGAYAAAATASVPVGQVASVPFGNCGSNDDRAQKSVSSGPAYAMPTDGTLTSWSTTAGSGGAQQWTLKIYRQVTPTTYVVVAHDGPQPLNIGHALSTFAVSIPVKKGDLLGAHMATTGTDCIQQAVATDVTFYDLASNNVEGGNPFAFNSVINSRLNISAQLEPVNTFTLGSVKRNKKKGTATIAVTVPGPGQVAASGSGVRAASAETRATATDAGEVQLLVKATGKKRKKLNKSGKVKITPTITYTPTGGTAASQTTTLKLKKKRH